MKPSRATCRPRHSSQRHIFLKLTELCDNLEVIFQKNLDTNVPRCVLWQLETAAARPFGIPSWQVKCSAGSKLQENRQSIMYTITWCKTCLRVKPLNVWQIYRVPDSTSLDMTDHSHRSWPQPCTMCSRRSWEKRGDCGAMRGKHYVRRDACEKCIRVDWIV